MEYPREVILIGGPSHRRKIIINNFTLEIRTPKYPTMELLKLANSMEIKEIPVEKYILLGIPNFDHIEILEDVYNKIYLHESILPEVFFRNLIMDYIR